MAMTWKQSRLPLMKPGIPKANPLSFSQIPSRERASAAPVSPQFALREVRIGARLKRILAADVDECTSGGHSCHKHAVCRNTVGSYECKCREGYEGDGEKCVDSNECERSNECSAHAKCVNTVGSYKCVCKAGFQGDGKTCKST